MREDAGMLESRLCLNADCPKRGPEQHGHSVLDIQIIKR
jgi:hypothetical protein